MRKLGLIDVLTAARALSAASRCEWTRLAHDMLDRAHQADAIRLKTGQQDPRYGNGTLEASARRHHLSEGANFADADFRRAVMTVLVAVAEHDHSAPRAGYALWDRRIEVKPFE